MAQAFPFAGIIGTGGIGAGELYAFDDDRTLGRNESRLAQKLPNRDYCKQHIILHYTARLRPQGFGVWPIGRVGRDAAGDAVMDMMQHAGMDTRLVARDDAPTLFSVCFLYPDGDGGNITTQNSASDRVCPQDIQRGLQALDACLPQGSRCMVLAAPEVPLETRLALLKGVKQRGYFTAASVAQAEADAFLQAGMLPLCDLLAVNRGEVAALCGLDESLPPEQLAVECSQKLLAQCPNLQLLMTFGTVGAYAAAGKTLRFIPPLPRKAVSTAGAGDAFLGGTLSALAHGLPLLPQQDVLRFGDQPLTSAAEVGCVVASLSVESADTIHAGIDFALVRAELARQGFACSAEVAAMLGQ